MPIKWNNWVIIISESANHFDIKWFARYLITFDDNFPLSFDFQMDRYCFNFIVCCALAGTAVFEYFVDLVSIIYFRSSDETS